MDLKNLQAYEVVEQGPIPDLNSEGAILRHRKTGARVVLLSNDDENKVFCIGFRTPPEDSTGVPHIIEHSVLCGSKRFPVKDPFVEMAKGSLNTFLNAMTYPDKTIYPVASCNDKDFQNLMHIYLDAVFYPNIYTNEKIFKQEGWHYECDGLQGELTVNGVVYNEMKGAFSSPDDVMYREISTSLYPDNTYGVESGGDPEVIPQLSYEQFLDFHRRYYHPSNSYIYLYGNMDMAEKLTFIDEQYLSSFDALSIDSAIRDQAPFSSMHRVEKEYPISDEEEEAGNSYLTWNVSVGNTLEQDLYVGFQILDYVLCSAPGAPLKQALVDKGLGKDVFSIYNNEIKQPYFSVVAKGTDGDRVQEFLDTIQGELKRLVREGIDKKALLAGINYYEFRYREADFGSAPKGLIYGMQILASWLYDDGKPFIHVAADATYGRMRQYVETDYFEQLVQKWLLDNPHSSLLVLKPKKGLTAVREAALREKLAEIKASMSESEVQKIMDDARELKAFQDSEDSEEAKATLPFLTREDMKKEATPILNEECTVGGTRVLLHEMFTNHIGYLRLIFDLGQVPEKYFPYAGVLASVLGMLNTEHYSYGALNNETNIWTGGISVNTNVYSSVKDPEKYTATLEVKVKALYENLPKALELMEEIMLTSDLADGKRLLEILAEDKMQSAAQMTSAGHRVAAVRATSYGSAAGLADEILSGLEQYRLVSGLEGHFEEKKEELTANLQTLVKMIFRPENLLVDYTGTKESLESLDGALKGLGQKLCAEEVEKASFHPVPVKKNEGFTTSGQVQYVCRAGNFRRKGLPFKGSLRVLRVMMGYDYLWVNVRVKGGAYGCMSNFAKTGDCYFVSYRDPNLEKTIEVFEKAAETVAGFQAEERTMAQFIIGAIGELDTPMNPSARGFYSLNAYMTEQTNESIQRERDELLAVTPEEIRSLSAYIKAFMEDDCLCVVGNADRLKSREDLFLNMQSLV